VVEINTALKNMPEIGFSEIIQIFIFASLIAAVIFK
jgi:hypothetical protein